MKNLVATFLILLLCSHHLLAEELTPERIFSSPSLDGESIRGLKISPDGSRVTFLRGKEHDYERLDLWEYDLKSGQPKLLFDSDDLHQGDEKLSDEEKARRERLRFSGSGIVSYQWSKDGKALFFPLAGDIYYWRTGQKSARKVFSTPQFETDAKFSPKGNFISFIRDQNIVVLDLRNGKETALTVDGGGTIKNGMAEFVAQEEMDRLTGYWWAPDESRIAYLRVDESPVKEVTRSEIYADKIKMIQQRYPFAGSDNATVKLGVVTVDGDSTKWVDLGTETDFYLPRVKWTKSSDTLTYQWQSRDQKRLELRKVRIPELTQSTLLTESSKTWVNLNSDLKFLKNKKHFIWASEKDGYKHLYLYDLNGKLVRRLTRGKWVVDELEAVAENSGTVFFTGRKDTPIERHLYRVSLEGGEIRRVTGRKGFHDITFAKDGSKYIDNFSTVKSPPQVSLHGSDGSRVTWLLENKVDKDHPLFPYLADWIEPKFGHFTTNGGVKLYYRMYLPAGFEPTGKYPVLVYLYGGPGAQRVTNSWGRKFSQYMAQQGYVVFTLDNRGSYNRGKAFEDPIHLHLGDVELQDQIEGVKFLHQYPWIDRERVGVHGSSYGGYMTLMALFKAPEYFKAGVSGAPVTDWTLYDTHYTERYLSTPQENPEGYKKSAVFDYATNLQGPLLIYHGMADDNVLFKNSTKLYKLLQDNNIWFSVMDYPGKKHRFQGKKTSMHRLNLVRRYFDIHFGVERD